MAARFRVGDGLEALRRGQGGVRAFGQELTFVRPEESGRGARGTKEERRSQRRKETESRCEERALPSLERERQGTNHLRVQSVGWICDHADDVEIEVAGLCREGANESREERRRFHGEGPDDRHVEGSMRQSIRGNEDTNEREEVTSQELLLREGPNEKEGDGPGSARSCRKNRADELRT